MWLNTPSIFSGHYQVDINTIMADHNIVKTFELELMMGRSFSHSFSTDAGGSLILNEAAARLLEWDDPVGKRLNGETVSGTVVGVVKDFHYESLHQPISPLAIVCFPWWINHLSLRIHAGDIAQILTFVEDRWHAFHPGWPFEYGFLDQDFEHSYNLEDRIGRMIQAFTVLAIILSCAGLLALASFMVAARTKEIGVRKVMGASVGSILTLLGREFVVLIGLAILIAWPIAYTVIAWWLDDFAYRITIDLMPFIAAGAITLIIACLTIGYHAVKAATANPIDALRNE